MTTALALRNAQLLVPAAPIGPGTAVRTLAGSVSAFFTIQSCNRRTGVATYGLRVVNQTASSLICRIWAVTKKSGAVPAYPMHFNIQPFSTTTAEVPVRARDFDSFQRAIAEVVGDDVHCVVEAPPIFVARSGAAFAAAACLVLGLLAVAIALAGWTALADVQPRIAAFAVPPVALSGTTVQAEYSASGAGTLAYQVTAPDGHRLQGGTLANRAGSIPVRLPAQSDPGAYTLQMTMQAPFGNVKEVRVLNALPPRRGAGAQIANVQISPVAAKPGQTIDVAYAASGDGGYIRLTGNDGTVWAQKPFSRDGATSFVVPPVGRSTEMRVVVHVTKGRSVAQSSAGFVIESVPAAAVAAAPRVQIAGDDNPAPVTDSGANGTFQLASSSVRANGAIKVQVLSPRNGMRIVLNDESSREVVGVSVGSDAGAVTLKAPSVKVPTRYTIVANFTDGFGQESVVEPVTVRP